MPNFVEISSLFASGISASENTDLAAKHIPEENEIPTFEVKAEGNFWYPPGKLLGGIHGCHLVFKCPKCKKKNYHGGTYGKKGDGDGHRCAHCSCWPRGYYLKEV